MPLPLCWSGANFGAGPRSIRSRSTMRPTTAASRRRRQDADLGVVDDLAPEREVGDEQRHGEADAGEHGHAARRGASPTPSGSTTESQRARRAPDAPMMPTILPTTSPATMPIVTRLGQRVVDRVAASSTTPGVGEREHGTITKLDPGCSARSSRSSTGTPRRRARRREQSEDHARDRRLDARLVEAHPQHDAPGRRRRADRSTPEPLHHDDEHGDDRDAAEPARAARRRSSRRARSRRWRRCRRRSPASAGRA